MDQCINEKGCSKCGRPYCSGQTCQKCSTFCWEIEEPIPSHTNVMNGLSSQKRIDCIQHWHLIWSNHNFKHPTTSDPKFSLPELYIRVKFITDDKTEFNSYFESVSWGHNKLTVGNYIGGNGGNHWGAPFTDLATKFIRESNCHGFFMSSSSCNIDIFPSYDEQMAQNATKIRRRFYWPICNTMHSINVIQMFVAPQSLKEKLNIVESKAC